MANDKILAVRIPSQMKDRLDNKFPDNKMRNLAIRALIQKFLDGKIPLAAYELEIKTT